MYYILFYKTVEDYIEKRVPFREAHLKLAMESFNRGELMLAGALTDPSDSAVLVFKCENPSAAEEFAKNDPYVLNGIVTEWEVRPWTVVIGG
ncbi:MAG: YciI family protein [Ignavibacteriales bacterium]|nr:YciI family protein [Ignavibacteriales bacterium]